MVPRSTPVSFNTSQCRYVCENDLGSERARQVHAAYRPLRAHREGGAVQTESDELFQPDSEDGRFDDDSEPGEEYDSKYDSEEDDEHGM